MIEFKKGKTPDCLTIAQATPDATYDSVDGACLRPAHIEEQVGLCAYCQRRIQNVHTSIRTDHYVPRSRGGAQLAWSNLIGSCADKQTCDAHKKSDPLFLTPIVGVGPRPSQHLRYLKSGRVEAIPKLASSVRASVEQDIRTLNLQQPYLVRARNQSLQELETALTARGFKKRDLRRLADTLPTSGNPYAFVQLAQVHRWLKKFS